MRRIMVLLSGLLLSACVPAPPTTPQTAAIAPDTLGLGAEAAPRLPDDWWKAFHDPQVDRLAALLETGNPTLAGAMARIRAAEAQLSATRAGDYPQLSLDAQEQRELFSDDFIYPKPFAGTWRWMGEAQANLSWNLDFWGKQADLIAKARHTAEAASLDAAAARLALSGALADTYIDLLLAYQDGDIADATVAERQGILSLTQNRFAAGLENASAVEEAKAGLALARDAQLALSAKRQTDMHAIAALTGQGAAAAITRPAPNLDAALPLPRNLPADLLSRRPDILAARARVEAAAAGRAAAHAEFYPDINLAAFVGWQAIGLSNLFTGDALALGAGPALHLPIFDAGRIRAGYAGATADLDAAVADYNGAVLAAIRQTADAMTGVESLERRRVEEQAALDSAARGFALAEERYKDGLSGQLPMLAAEATLLEARQRMAALAAQSAVQRITLLLSVGGGFNPVSAPALAADQDKTDQDKNP